MSTRRELLTGVVAAGAAFALPERATTKGTRNSIRLRTHE